MVSRDAQQIARTEIGTHFLKGQNEIPRGGARRQRSEVFLLFTLTLLLLVERRHIPQFNRSILSAGYQIPAIGAELDTVDFFEVACLNPFGFMA